MFNWLTNLFSARPVRSAAPRALRMVRARYDAAVTNEDNRRHWANADGLSANSANGAEVRRILRNRSRYEVANNSYARGIVLTLAHDVVGTGPRLQMLTADAEANRRIEQEFSRWAKAVGLAENLRTMRMARAADGEAFAVLMSNARLATDIQLDLRLIEADQVCTPDLDARSGNAVDGIVFDGAGNPVEYHILKRHPGESSFGVHREYDRLPASSVIHWYRCDRPGQARGIPDIMPALPLFAQLRRFTLAVLAAAETAADFAGILYTDAPANGARRRNSTGCAPRADCRSPCPRHSRSRVSRSAPCSPAGRPDGRDRHPASAAPAPDALEFHGSRSIRGTRSVRRAA